MSDDLTRLREIAAAAMCDNWYLQPFTHEGSMWVEVRAEAEFDDGKGYDKFLFQTQDSEAASFIATFDPPTVTALIERAERAERERDELSGELDRVRESNGPVYHDEVCAYFVMQKDLRAELAALRAAVTGLADDLASTASGVETTLVAGARFGKLRDVQRQLRGLLTDEGDNQ